MELLFEQVVDVGGRAYDFVSVCVCVCVLRDKAQMSAPNVKWPRSSVSHPVSSSVALLFNYCRGDKRATEGAEMEQDGSDLRPR